MWFKTTYGPALLLLGLLLVAPQTADAAGQDDTPGAAWRRESTSCFLIGVALERAADNVYGGSFLRDQLVGVSGHYRGEHLGLGARLLMSPKLDVGGIPELRGLFGLDLRAYLELWQIDWSYGVGAAAELRFADHFWLFYLTPLELGATVYQKGSLHVRLFAGLRYLTTGALLNSFLLDPNGFNNENAQDLLTDERDQPFEGFVRIVFSRRID